MSGLSQTTSGLGILLILFTANFPEAGLSPSTSTPEVEPGFEVTTVGAPHIDLHNAAAEYRVRPGAVETAGGRLAADTLTFEITAGQVFITILPDSVRTGEIIDIANIRVPARSLRTGRAFFWQTDPGRPGVQYIDFFVRTASSADTLTLVVDVTR